MPYTIPPDTQYERCARCWHFIEANDVDPEDYAAYGIIIAPYVHLDSGEKEHNHDAEPSGDTRTLARWRADHPELFVMHRDGYIGPNSAHFQPAAT